MTMVNYENALDIVVVKRKHLNQESLFSNFFPMYIFGMNCNTITLFWNNHKYPNSILSWYIFIKENPCFLKFTPSQLHIFCGLTMDFTNHFSLFTITIVHSGNTIF